MSQSYRYQFEITPVKTKEEIREVFLKVSGEYEIEEDHLLMDKSESLHLWGSGSMNSVVTLDERHDELQKLFPGKKVVTRWRCTEYDDWDESIGEGDDDE